MGDLASQLAGIIQIALREGSVSDLSKTISALVDQFLFPSFPRSALPQFYSILALNAVLGLISIACIAIRLRNKNFFLFSIRDRCIVINTPVIFSSLLLAYLTSNELSVWRISEILNGKDASMNLILFRMFSWLTVWLAGYYKAYGIVTAASINTQAMQLDPSSLHSSGRLRILSVLFAVVVPLLYSATTVGTHIWSNIVCNRSFGAYGRVMESLLLFQNTTVVDDQHDLLQLVVPLKELTELDRKCLEVDRVTVALWGAWLVFGVFCLGSYAFFVMVRKLKSHINIFERVLNDLRRLAQIGNPQTSLEEDTELKVSALRRALFNLKVHAFGLFGSSLSYLGGTVFTLVLGAKASDDTNVAIIHLWYFWTFIAFGTPGLILNFQRGLDDGSFLGLSSSSDRRETHSRKASGSSAMDDDLEIGQPRKLMSSCSSYLGTDEDLQSQSHATTESSFDPPVFRIPENAFIITEASFGPAWFSAGKPSAWKEQKAPSSL
ncbi:hypothetical protein BT69DRAFT_1285222 [Atractiella rhizophila]|nr:hypothetical protein BT69DRAFT_1285222 [Atractiella rhizophila]